MNKKKIIATASAVALAAVLAFGGTLAYYQGQAESPVENNLVDQGNKVSISESGVDGSESTQSNTYSIVPGTTDKKDPVVTAEYTLDSYVYVTVSDETGTWITWDPASAWTLLDGDDDVYYLLLETVQYEENSSDWTSSETDGSTTYTYTGTTETGYTYTYDGNSTYTVSKDDVELYTYTVTTSAANKSENPIDVYTAKIHVIEDDTISYSSSITNSTYEDYGQIISLDFGAYIIQADIAGSDDVNESALSCWNALNASTGTSSVNAGNVAVTTTTTTDDDGNETSTTTTSEQLVVTSADSAYSATVPSGVTIDTETADIVTTTDSEGNAKTTTTLILVVENIGDNYSADSGLTVTTRTGQTATVYDVSIIGVDSKNNTVMEIAMDIGTGLYNVEVEHEGIDLTELTEQQRDTPYTDDVYYYDSDEGILYIYTDTFSEFAVYSMTSAYVTSDGETGYNTLDDAVYAGNVVVNEDTNVVYSTLTSAIKDASDGDTVTMLADMEENVTLSKSITLNLNDKTLTGTSTSNPVVTLGTVTTTITDGTISGGYRGIYSNSTAFELTLDGVTITESSSEGLYINSGAGKVQTLTITGDTEISGNGSKGIYGLGLTLIMESGTISNNGAEGVWVSSFTMSGGTISDNKGVGVYNTSGTFVMNGGKICDNSTGGVCVGNFTMNDGTISGNKGSSGAAVYGGTFVMNGGTISDNTVTGNGGAVYGSNVTINDGTITGTTGGSGIYMNGGTLTISGGTISDNTGKTYGGGVYCGNKCTFVMSGGTITGNSSTSQGTGIYFDSQNISATISGGSILYNNVVKNDVITENSNNIRVGSMKPVISGGTFSFSVSSYLADGYTQTYNTDGTYTVSASSSD